MGLDLMVFFFFFFLIPNVYQIRDGVIWLTPEKGHLISTAPICWEQI